jgi:hypothetical protein
MTHVAVALAAALAAGSAAAAYEPAASTGPVVKQLPEGGELSTKKPSAPDNRTAPTTKPPFVDPGQRA